jgi:hypothetical protein
MPSVDFTEAPKAKPSFPRIRMSFEFLNLTREDAGNRLPRADQAE